LAKQSAACTAAGKPPITSLSFPSNDRAFSAVAHKRADIMMTDVGVVAYLAKTASDVVEPGYAITSDFRLGFGTRKNDENLMNALRDVFHAMYEDGSLKAEYDKWSFDDSQFVEPVTKTK